MQKKTLYPPVAEKLRLLAQYHIRPHLLMSDNEAGYLIDFLQGTDGQPIMANSLARIFYYKRMQKDFGDKVARDLRTELTHTLLYFVPLKSETVIASGNRELLLYARVRTPEGGVKSLEPTKFEVIKNTQ